MPSSGDRCPTSRARSSWWRRPRPAAAGPASVSPGREFAALAQRHVAPRAVESRHGRSGADALCATGTAALAAAARALPGFDRLGHDARDHQRGRLRRKTVELPMRRRRKASCSASRPCPTAISTSCPSPASADMRAATQLDVARRRCPGAAGLPAAARPSSSVRVAAAWPSAARSRSTAAPTEAARRLASPMP